MQINDKADMYRLYLAGELGNKPETWTSLEDLLATGGDGPFAVRSRKPNHPLFLFMVPRDRIEAEVKKACLDYDLRQDQLCYIRPLPEFSRTVQGELVHVSDGRLYLYYSTAPHHMREALSKAGRHAYGSAAVQVLRSHLDPEDVDHLYSLLDRFPGHVVEFTGFTQRVGLEDRRMVVWECRRY